MVPTLETAATLTKDREVFGRFIAGYQSARGDRRLPTLQAYMLGELLPFLEEVTVLDVKGPDAIIYRFCGTKVVERLGREMTGQNLFELTPPEHRELMSTDIGAMVNHPCGNYSRYYNRYADGRRVASESLSVPVQSDADPAKNFLLSLHYVEETAETGRQADDAQIGTDWLQSVFLDIGAGTPGDTSLSKILPA